LPFHFSFKRRQKEESGNTASPKLTLILGEPSLLLLSYWLGARLSPQRDFPLTPPHASLPLPLHEHPILPSYNTRTSCTTHGAKKGSCDTYRTGQARKLLYPCAMCV
jgi:hypothetical protein